MSRFQERTLARHPSCADQAWTRSCPLAASPPSHSWILDLVHRPARRACLQRAALDCFPEASALSRNQPRLRRACRRVDRQKRLRKKAPAGREKLMSTAPRTPSRRADTPPDAPADSAAIELGQIEKHPPNRQSGATSASRETSGAMILQRPSTMRFPTVRLSR